MRWFTTISMTMLCAACASIVGIDTDRSLLLDGGASTSSSSGTVTPNDASSDAPDGGSSSSGDVDANTHRAFESCNDVLKQCTQTCDNGSCTSGIYDCREGYDCTFACKGDGCKGATCNGGKSCTFECRTSDCSHAACASQSCTFNCGQGQGCDNLECIGTPCTKVCWAGDSIKQCKQQ